MTETVEFYDRTMTEPGAPAMRPLEESPWLPVYREAAGWIPTLHDVVDLGCGTGRFLSLIDTSERRDAHHHGIDFSQAALDEARTVLYDDRTLECLDLREWQPEPERAGNTTYVCLEVLEHLDDDLDLVRRVPPGHQFVLSVPNYESESHVRWFRSVGELWDRYAGLLEYRRLSLIPIDDRKLIYAIDAKRRQDSW